MPVREVALALGWVPVGEVALALGCLLDKVFGGFGRFWRAPGGFGGFWRVLEGFGGWSDRTSSTPAVVPGAAPALAKAGVGGFVDRPCGSSARTSSQVPFAQAREDAMQSSAVLAALFNGLPVEGSEWSEWATSGV